MIEQVDPSQGMGATQPLGDGVELSLVAGSTYDGTEASEHLNDQVVTDGANGTQPDNVDTLKTSSEVSSDAAELVISPDTERATVPERARRLVNIVRSAGYVACAAAAGIELNHLTNEGWRINLLGAIERHTGNSMLATLGASGLLFTTEFGAAIGSTVILHSPRAKQLAKWFNRKTVKPEEGSSSMPEADVLPTVDMRAADPSVLEPTKHSRTLPKLSSVKNVIPEKARSGVITALQSTLIGTPSLLARYHANDPNRTVSRDVRDGFITSAALSVGLAVPTYYAASAAGKVAQWEGRHSDEFTIGGLSAMAVLGLWEVAKNRRLDREEARRQEKLPNYELGPEKLRELESEMAEEVRRRHGETLAAIWLPHDSPYANVARTHEAEYFKELPQLMEGYEDVSRFLTLVDTRAGTDRVVHMTRISYVEEKDWQQGPMLPGQNNDPKIAFMQDLVSSGQVTYKEISEFYDLTGTTLDSCTSVESNRRVGEWVPDFIDGVSTTDLSYLAVANFTTDRVRGRERTTGIFAHLNAKSKESLGKAGTFWCSVAERPDLKTPTISVDGSEVGPKFDDAYTPVFLPGNVQNTALFDALRDFAPPAFELADRVPKPKRSRTMGRLAFASN